MKKKGLALLSVVVMSMGIAGLVSTAFALAPYLTVFNAKYGTSFDCSVCHVSPGGGGPRNSYGSAFEAVATHDANPAGAIAAIESLPSKCSGFTNLQLINLGINPGSGTCPAATVPLPTLAQVFPAYAEIASAVTNPNPAIMEPIAVGSVATGGATVDLSVNTGSFSGNVDIYFALTVPGSPNIFLLTPAGGQVFSGTLVPWQSSVSGANVVIISGVPKALLPSGTYNLFLAVTPAGSLNAFYLWQTSLVLP